ncbi:MAG: class I SAM-dependent methyltransferase [Euryarchaeota archaeon]|nr:class I SAM-dependent methyltransferase [Euryarchaeota archaeon]
MVNKIKSKDSGHIEIKDIIRERWNEHCTKYDRHGYHSGEGRDAWKALLTRALGDEKLSVLDVGCGTGIITLPLAELGHNVTGIDLSEGMLNIAKEKASNLDLSIEFKLGDADFLPFEDGLFDVVINRHLLWTLPNPEKAVSEWKRVLTPGGKIMIIDGNWDGRRRLHERIWRYLISAPLVLITERRSPFQGHYDRDTEKKLPMRYKERPQADIKILENLGFSVDVMDVPIPVFPRTRSLMGVLKYGCWGGRGSFLVKGIKEER